MGAITPLHLIVILVIALLIVGPGKLPQTGEALGKAIRGFRDAADGKGEATAAPTAAPADPGANEGDRPS